MYINLSIKRQKLNKTDINCMYYTTHPSRLEEILNDCNKKLT